MLINSTGDKSKSANVSPDTSMDGSTRSGTNSPHSYSANTSYDMYKNSSPSPGN